MGSRVKRGCFVVLVALFTTAFILAILNVSYSIVSIISGDAGTGDAGAIPLVKEGDIDDGRSGVGDVGETYPAKEKDSGVGDVGETYPAKEKDNNGEVSIISRDAAVGDAEAIDLVKEVDDDEGGRSGVRDVGEFYPAEEKHHNEGGGPKPPMEPLKPHRAQDKDNNEGSEPEPPMELLKPRRRVAVCFFGLTRSLRWTLPSIEKRLLGVLRDSGMGVDVFVHTYHLLEVNNNRAGERGIDYHQFEDDFLALNATRTSVTNQDEFDRIWPDPLSLTRYNWNYGKDNIDSLIRNVFRAYWSVATVWSLLVQHSMETNTRYDAVVLARPDVWFHVDTDLPKRTFPLPERTVVLPSFESDQDNGRKNDRFAYGSMTAMGVVMNRIATLTDPKADQYKGQIDSEWLMGHHLKVNDIEVETMEFSVTRVRLTGDIPFFDHERVEEACQSGEDPMACEMVELGFKFPIEHSEP